MWGSNGGDATVTKCTDLAVALRDYSALPYDALTRSMWMLAAVECVISLLSLGALIPGGHPILRTMRRPPAIVGLLLTHIELLNAFFALEDRRQNMIWSPETVERFRHECPPLGVKVPYDPAVRYNFMHRDPKTAAIVLAFICSCVACVLLLRFLVNSFNQKEAYDDIEREYHAYYEEQKAVAKPPPIRRMRRKKSYDPDEDSVDEVV